MAAWEGLLCREATAESYMKPIRPGLIIWPRIETWKSVKNMKRIISEKYGKIGYAQDGNHMSED